MNATISTRTISKVERSIPEYKIVTHPRGGNAIARRDVGSTVWIYESASGSVAELAEIIKKRKDAAIKAAFAGKLIGTDEAGKEVQLAFEMEGGRPGFRKI